MYFSVILLPMIRNFTLFALFFSAICVFADTFSPQVIKVEDEDEISKLEEQGVNILRRRENILLCLVPMDDNNEIIIPNSTRKVPAPTQRGGKSRHKPFSGFNTPALDVAVSHYDAADIINGKIFDQPYTGKGVVVGICDIGFDPLHPTFLDSDGKSRVKRITQYKEREGIRLQLEGDDQYEEWQTDNPDEYHATHVCGILAGNGAGSPYTGIASDAEIVVSTSTLSDVGLLAGVEDIIDYAKEVGKPAVINLSMGNHTGAHDGTSLFSQYLDLCADDAIIVLSSGNQGHRTNYLQSDFTPDRKDLGFRLGNSKWTQINMYGMTDIWGEDISSLTLEISIHEEENYSIVYTYPPMILEDYEVRQIVWDPANPVFEGCALDGYMLLSGGVNPENGRRQIMLMYDYDSPDIVDKGWARYVIAVKVSGDPGNSAEVFSDGVYTRLMKLSGYPSPNTEMTISDLACGHRVVSVGMYGNRASMPFSIMDNMSGAWIIEEKETGIEPMSTIPYSSYGTLHDGRILPLTVAPGYELISSLSRPYLDSHPETDCLRLDAPWLAEGGTSMSSPYVAGFIATLLEAYPTLSSEDIIRIVTATNRTDIPDCDDPHNANGWFDPVAALLLAKHEAGIEEIETDPTEEAKSQERVITLSGLPATSDLRRNSLHKKAKSTKIIF